MQGNPDRRRFHCLSRRLLPGQTATGLEFVGRAETVTGALKSLRRSGRLVVVGVGPDRVTLPPLQVFVGLEAALIGSMGFHRADLEAVIKLVAAGGIDLGYSVGQARLSGSSNYHFMLNCVTPICNNLSPKRRNASSIYDSSSTSY